jgi:CRP-like cAMP-binding protein
VKAGLGLAELGRLREFGLRVLSRSGPLSSEDERIILSALSDQQRSPAGYELIAEGDELDRPFLLLEGWAVRQRVLTDGRRQIFSFVLPGDGLGFCARSGGVSLCNIVTLTPVTVAPMPLLSEAVRRAQGSPMHEVAWNMLSTEESFMHNQVVRLGRQSAHERLIHLLLEFHDRLGAVGLADNGRFFVPFTQEVLSDALGLSTVHTNRTLQQLRRERLVETQSTMIKLLDTKLLEEIADYRRSPRLKEPR